MYLMCDINWTPHMGKAILHMRKKLKEIKSEINVLKFK